MCGDIPFESDQSICSGHLYFTTKVSQQCRDLIQQCLRVCPTERIGLHQIQNHPWMCSGEETISDAVDYGNVAQLDHKSDRYKYSPVFCQHPPKTYPKNVPGAHNTSPRLSDSISSSFGSF